MYKTIGVVSVTVLLGVLLIFLFADRIQDFTGVDSRDKFDWEEWKKRHKMKGEEKFPTTNRSKYVPWEEVQKEQKRIREFRAAREELERWNAAVREANKTRQDRWDEAADAVQRWKMAMQYGESR